MLPPYTVSVTRRLALLSLLLALFSLGLDVHARELARVVLENGELALPLGERSVVDLVGRQLLVDPLHHARRRDAVHLAWSGAVGETVQRVQRGVTGREQGRLGARPHQGRGAQRPAQTRHGPDLHTVILTHSPRGKLRL